MTHNPIRPWRNIDRRESRQIMVGNVPVGGGAPISVRLIKRLVHQNQTMDLRSSLDMVSSHMTLARMSDDHVEAIAAWREKRPGVFKGS